MWCGKTINKYRACRMLIVGLEKKQRRGAGGHWGGCGYALVQGMVRKGPLKWRHMSRPKESKAGWAFWYFLLFGGMPCQVGELVKAKALKQQLAWSIPGPRARRLERVSGGRRRDGRVQSKEDLVGLQGGFGLGSAWARGLWVEKWHDWTSVFAGSRGDLFTEAGGKPAFCGRRCRARRVGGGPPWKASLKASAPPSSRKSGRQPAAGLREEAQERWGKERVWS